MLRNLLRAKKPLVYLQEKPLERPGKIHTFIHYLQETVKWIEKNEFLWNI